MCRVSIQPCETPSSQRRTAPRFVRAFLCSAAAPPRSHRSRRTHVDTVCVDKGGPRIRQAGGMGLQKLNPPASSPHWNTASKEAGHARMCSRIFLVVLLIQHGARQARRPALNSTCFLSRCWLSASVESAKTRSLDTLCGYAQPTRAGGLISFCSDLQSHSSALLVHHTAQASLCLLEPLHRGLARAEGAAGREAGAERRPPLFPRGRAWSWGLSV